MTSLSPSEFLGRIWPQKLLTNETLELRIIDRKSQKIKREFFRSPQELLKRASEAKGMDIYFGVSTRLGNGGKKRDCYRCCVIWVDLDNKKLSDCHFDIKPDLIVESGNGLHVYWLLESPVLVRDERWKQIEERNRWACKKFGGDIGAIDVSRILRIPGFSNQKYSPPRQVKAYAL